MKKNFYTFSLLAFAVLMLSTLTFYGCKKDNTTNTKTIDGTMWFADYSMVTICFDFGATKQDICYAGIYVNSSSVATVMSSELGKIISVGTLVCATPGKYVATPLTADSGSLNIETPEGDKDGSYNNLTDNSVYITTTIPFKASYKMVSAKQKGIDIENRVTIPWDKFISMLKKYS